jgi:hypothetical protein
LGTVPGPIGRRSEGHASLLEVKGRGPGPKKEIAAGPGELLELLVDAERRLFAAARRWRAIAADAR